MSVNDAMTAAIEDRRAKAWALRVAGSTLREIAAKLGISLGLAHRDCEAVLDRTRAEANESAERHTAIVLDRIDRCIAVLMPMLDDPDPEVAMHAMDRIDKFDRQRATLLGLNAPMRQEISGPGGAPIEIDDRAALIARIAGLTAGEPPAGA